MDYIFGLLQEVGSRENGLGQGARQRMVSGFAPFDHQLSKLDIFMMNILKINNLHVLKRRGSAEQMAKEKKVAIATSIKICGLHVTHASYQYVFHNFH